MSCYALTLRNDVEKYFPLRLDLMKEIAKTIYFFNSLISRDLTFSSRIAAFPLNCIS